MLRRLMPVAVLGAAVGVPYVATQWPQLKASVLGMSRPASAGTSTSNYSAMPELPAVVPNGVPMGAGMNPQAEETPIVDMSEAFRWETTPQLVLHAGRGCRRDCQAKIYTGCAWR